MKCRPVPARRNKNFHILCDHARPLLNLPDFLIYSIQYNLLFQEKKKTVNEDSDDDFEQELTNLVKKQKVDNFINTY